MTTPLIEAIARQLTMTLRHHGVEMHPEDIAGLAQAALTAITEAGMVICPREPSEAMLELGLCEAESCTNDWTASAACLPGHVWKAMIRAATPLDTKEGE